MVKQHQFSNLELGRTYCGFVIKDIEKYRKTRKDGVCKNAKILRIGGLKMELNENDIELIINWFRANQLWTPFYETIESGQFIIGFIDSHGIKHLRNFYYE